MSEIIRIPDIENYTIEFINGELIAIPRESYITEDEFNNTDLNSSIIKNCIVKNGDQIISNNLKYKAILNDIWSTMPIQTIINNTNFNMTETNPHGKGYRWFAPLELYIQYKAATNTMREILNMIKLNNYSIKITIQLRTNTIINFRFNPS